MGHSASKQMRFSNTSACKMLTYDWERFIVLLVICHSANIQRFCTALHLSWTENLSSLQTTAPLHCRTSLLNWSKRDQGCFAAELAHRKPPWKFSAGTAALTMLIYCFCFHHSPQRCSLQVLPPIKMIHNLLRVCLRWRAGRAHRGGREVSGSRRKMERRRQRRRRTKEEKEADKSRWGIKKIKREYSEAICLHVSKQVNLV